MQKNTLVMIQSMTGYGKASATFGDKKINVEIKSLNSKAMDLSTRIAPLYREKEIEIRNMVSKSLERGKVDFSLWIEKEASTSAAQINIALAQSYDQQMQKLSEALGWGNYPNEYSMATLLRMPDIMSKDEIIELSEEEWEVVRQVVEEAIAHLVDFRKQEGAALEKKFNWPMIILLIVFQFLMRISMRSMNSLPMNYSMKSTALMTNPRIKTMICLRFLL